MLTLDYGTVLGCLDLSARERYGSGMQWLTEEAINDYLSS